MKTKSYITCEDCGGHDFVIDMSRTYFSPPDPMPPLTIDGYTEYTHDPDKHPTYLWCEQCGWQLPNAVKVQKTPESITITMLIPK